MSAAAALTAGIAATGVRHMFGVPGSGATLELIDAAEKQGIAFHTTYFEGTAAIMAGTVGHLSGVPGVALAIKGPGLANMIPGIAACWFEGFPLVAAIEAYPAGTDWQGRHKGIDQRALTTAVCKAHPGSGDGTGYEAASAFAAAEAPGPVVLELNGGPPALPEVAGLAAANGAVAERVARSQTPVVIAGTLAVRQGWGERLGALGVPVLTTAAAKGALDETLPHAAGVYTGVGLERTAEAAVLPKADLVVGMGLRPGEVLAVKPFACDAVNVDDMPPHDGFGFSATTGASAAADVLSELAGHEWGTTAVQFASAKLRMAMQSGAFLPAHVFEAVDHRFDGRVRAVFDTGYFCTIGEHVWRARRADWFLIAGLGRYMGTALPMALAAALHDNQVPTVAFLGDGGIGTYVGELRLAVRLKLPLLVVLLTDGGFSSLRTRAIRDGLTQKPLVMADPSWLGIVEALGIPGIRTKTLAAFTEALNAWTGTGGPAYLEVPFDPESYQGMMDGIR